MPDDGYESPELAAALLPQAEQVSDAAAAARPSMLREWAIKLGLVKANPFMVPQLSPSEQMQLQLRRSFGAPLPPQRSNAVAQPVDMWRSYSNPAPATLADPAWADIAQAAAQREKIVSEFGDFSKKVLSNPYLVGVGQ